MSTTKKQPRKTYKATTPKGRASYPSVFEPRNKYVPPGTKAKVPPDMEYSIEVLFPKGTDLSEFNAKCEEALIDKFGADKSVWPKNISRPMIDQEVMIDTLTAKGKNTSHLEAGAFYARFKSAARPDMPKPQVFDQNKNILEDVSKIYGGCFVKVACNIVVNVIAGTDPSTRKPVQTVYVTPYLTGVQFVGDGDSFGGGRASVADMFEPVTFDNSADDLMG